MNTSEEIQDGAASPSRRNLLGKAGLGVLATAALIGTPAADLLTGKANAQTAPDYSTDLAVLNFALNLEYLEAEFYTITVMGSNNEQLAQPRFAITGTGNTGPTTGGSKVDFSSNPVIGTTAGQVMVDEQTHVTLLRAAIKQLGGEPVAKPTINLDALGIGYASIAEFLTLARAFEDTGVTAYNGAASLLTGAEVISYAASILAVESYHASNWRLQLALNNIKVGKTDPVDVVPPPSGKQFFNTVNGLAVQRTPKQVLGIVYGGANKSGGAFFPNGVNGALYMS